MKREKAPPRAVIDPFVVRLSKTTWMGPDGKPVEDEQQAQRFELYRSPTMAEKMRAEKLAHEIAGGLAEWIDLQTGLEKVRATLRGDIIKRVWPEGMPDAKTPEETRALEAKFMEAWAQDDSEERKLFQSLNGMNDRIDFMARWEVTLLPTMPRDWRELRNRYLDDDAFYALWFAYNEAAAGVTAGKEKPSAS